jgi:hypothetical protein
MTWRTALDMTVCMTNNAEERHDGRPRNSGDSTSRAARRWFCRESRQQAADGKVVETRVKRVVQIRLVYQMR